MTKQQLRDIEKLLKALVLVAFLIFVILLIKSREGETISFDLKINYNKNLECSVTNQTSNESFLMYFSDYSDLQAFQEISEFEFDICKDIYNYPKYQY